MTENDVVRSATALGLDRFAPVHYDLWKGAQADPKGLHDHAASFHYPRSIEVVGVGDHLDVHRPGVQPLDVLDGNDDGGR